MNKKVLFILLALVMTLTLVPAFTRASHAASNDTTIDVNDSATAGGTNWKYDAGTKIFTVSGDVTITGTTTTNRVVVRSGTTANITLSGVDIAQSTTGNYVAALDMSGATVNLTLVGNNVLKGYSRPGLQAPDGSFLTINAANDATDKLTATAGANSAGIGGYNGAGGNITINGGNITANGGQSSAGIGGGANGAGGSITINGGTITANGGGIGAGIGGGQGGAGGNITINGGNITANGSSGSAGIGGGGGSGGNIIINGGMITANGGGSSSTGSGAGIGGGGNGSGGNITITSGATVTATGGSGSVGGGGAGIGSGGSNITAGAVDSIIIIEDISKVTAIGGTGGNGNGVKIGSGGGNGGDGSDATIVTTITYCAVTVTQATGGTIAAYPNAGATKVVSGASQTYKITPNAGCKIVSVTVDNVNVGAVTSWTIPNITNDNHTITAVFELVYGISLSETGTYTFTGATYGYAAQSPLTVTVTNKGTAATGALTVALSGGDAESFAISANNAAAGITTPNGTATFAITPNTGLALGTYTATVTVSNSNGISASFGVSFTVGKATPAAPSAPTLYTKTYNTVTLTANALYEFSKDGKTWQTSNVFSGLSPNTAYTFYQRVAETSDTLASEASPVLNVTTNAAPLTLDPLNNVTIGNEWTNLGDNASGTGWTWDASTKTLTLTGDLKDEIKIASETTEITVRVADNVNVPKIVKTGSGSLKITGSVGKTLSVSNTNGPAISSEGDIYIDSGTVKANVTGTGNTEPAIKAGGDITITGTANVIASNNGTGANSGGTASGGKTTISTTGGVNITSMDADAINATGGVEITNGVNIIEALGAGHAINTDNVKITGGTNTIEALGGGHAINANNGNGTISITGGHTEITDQGRGTNPYPPAMSGADTVVIVNGRIIFGKPVTPDNPDYDDKRRSSGGCDAGVGVFALALLPLACGMKRKEK
ncbi:hypothetical protein AGMMS50276_09790 [Synergistales bacterium]|nr:hypothetical protein AGMMS50276_09790 [Synergistales bacterium]